MLLPVAFYGQSLTGLWTGALSNDSNTVRKDQLFEIALTEYRGKVYGYSRSEFIVNDTLYYIVKRVKGTIEGDVCEVTDDEIIAFNFRGKLDKGIKVTSTFRRNKSDSSWYLYGTWKTNATKKYYAISGKVDLEEEKDLTASKIFPHLEELNLADNIAFYREKKEGLPIVRIAKPERVKTEYTAHADLVPDAPAKALFDETDYQRKSIVAGPTEQPVAVTVKEEKPNPDSILALKEKPSFTAPEKKPAIVKTEPVKEPTLQVTQTRIETVKTEPAKEIPVPIPEKKTETVKTEPLKETTLPVPEKNKIAPATEKKIETVKTAPKKETAMPVPDKRTEIVKTEPKKITTVPAPEKKTETVKNEPKPVPVSPVQAIAVQPVVVKPIEEITQKAAVIAGRKSEFSQVVDFKSDSLELSLYDNGEIDGDTVSVFMNGEVLMARQGLKASAIKKTIYIRPGVENDFTIVLFADNLGKYPPNTGLLVVHDGEDIYHLRFSSDFQKSTGIVFRKKK